MFPKGKRTWKFKGKRRGNYKKQALGKRVYELINIMPLTMLEYSHWGAQKDWMATRPAHEMLLLFLGINQKME